MMDLVGGVFLLLGSLFILLAAVGALRFDEVFSRIHAGAKAPALGVLAMGVGVALIIRTPEAVAAAVLVVVLQLIAGPVGAHMLGRSVYRDHPHDFAGPDELARTHPADPDG